MADPSPPRLSGDLEADETYVGGRPRNKGRRENRKRQGFGAARAKVPVFAIVQRGGDVRAQVMPKVTARNLRDAIRASADVEGSRLRTDDLHPYRKIGREFGRGHERVRHHLREYARGDVNTNTVEGFFSLIKRGIYGTFHSVSRKHLHRYVAEFEFRWNTRKIDDGARTVRAIKSAEGKRLRYREPL
jgi:hypothetical protein